MTLSEEERRANVARRTALQQEALEALQGRERLQREVSYLLHDIQERRGKYPPGRDMYLQSQYLKWADEVIELIESRRAVATPRPAAPAHFSPQLQELWNASPDPEAEAESWEMLMEEERGER